MALEPTSRSVSESMWVPALALLVAVRVAIPLVVLAAGSSKLPLVPQYEYSPLSGDAYGYYHAAANILAAGDGVFNGWIGAGAIVLMTCFSTAALIFWRGGLRWLAVLLLASAVSLIIYVLVSHMAAAGAGTIAWPLAWALTLSPLPVFGVALTPDRAFPSGLALGLIANATTVVATAFVGFRATGRRSVGLIAAALCSTWPLWWESSPVPAPGSTDNGTSTSGSTSTKSRCRLRSS